MIFKCEMCFEKCKKKIKLKKDVEDFIVDGWTQYKCMRECNILHRIQASTSFSTAHCTFSTVLCSSQFQRNQVSKQCPQTMQLCIWISITLNSVPFTEPSINRQQYERKLSYSQEILDHCHCIIECSASTLFTLSVLSPVSGRMCRRKHLVIRSKLMHRTITHISWDAVLKGQICRYQNNNIILILISGAI